MISKIAPAFSAMMMISSVNSFQYMKSHLDKRSVEFQDDMGCASCILNGYDFSYKALKSAKSNTELVASAGTYDSDNKCYQVTQKGALLESSSFKHPTIAMQNCPQKVDACGTTATGTIAKTGDAGVEFEVKALTGKDSCHYKVQVTCGLPVIEITEATGAFVNDQKKVKVEFIEGLGTYNMETDDQLLDAGEYAAMGMDGQLYNLLSVSSMFGDKADTLASAISMNSFNLMRIAQYENVSLDLIESSISLRNSLIAQYNKELKTYTTDFAAYQA